MILEDDTPATRTRDPSRAPSPDAPPSLFEQAGSAHQRTEPASYPDANTTSAIRKAFDEFDTDGSGTINASELLELLKTFGGSESNTSKLFEVMDSDGDGTISFQEFMDVMMKSVGERPVTGFRVLIHRVSGLVPTPMNPVINPGVKVALGSKPRQQWISSFKENTTDPVFEDGCFLPWYLQQSLAPAPAPPSPSHLSSPRPPFEGTAALPIFNGARLCLLCSVTQGRAPIKGTRRWNSPVVCPPPRLLVHAAPLSVPRLPKICFVALFYTPARPDGHRRALNRC